MTQSEEIETIRERNITIKLSDADVKRICETAGRAGLTVAELLQNFIGDLVDGTYSNGSDERMYANQWFDRCWFGNYNIDNNTFLKYLLYLDIVEDAILYWNEMKEYNNDDDREYYEQAKTDLNDLFSEYVEQIRENHDKPNLDNEMETVVKWWDEYRQLIVK